MLYRWDGRMDSTALTPRSHKPYSRTHQQTAHRQQATGYQPSNDRQHAARPPMSYPQPPPHPHAATMCGPPPAYLTGPEPLQLPPTPSHSQRNYPRAASHLNIGALPFQPTSGHAVGQNEATAQKRPAERVAAAKGDSMMVHTDPQSTEKEACKKRYKRQTRSSTVSQRSSNTCDGLQTREPAIDALSGAFSSSKPRVALPALHTGPTTQPGAEAPVDAPNRQYEPSRSLQEERTSQPFSEATVATNHNHEAEQAATIDMGHPPVKAQSDGEHADNPTSTSRADHDHKMAVIDSRSTTIQFGDVGVTKIRPSAQRTGEGQAHRDATGGPRDHGQELSRPKSSMKPASPVNVAAETVTSPNQPMPVILRQPVESQPNVSTAADHSDGFCPSLVGILDRSGKVIDKQQLEPLKKDKLSSEVEERGEYSSFTIRKRPQPRKGVVSTLLEQEQGKQGKKKNNSTNHLAPQTSRKEHAGESQFRVEAGQPKSSQQSLPKDDKEGVKTLNVRQERGSTRFGNADTRITTKELGSLKHRREPQAIDRVSSNIYAALSSGAGSQGPHANSTEGPDVGLRSSPVLMNQDVSNNTDSGTGRVLQPELKPAAETDQESLSATAPQEATTLELSSKQPVKKNNKKKRKKKPQQADRKQEKDNEASDEKVLQEAYELAQREKKALQACDQEEAQNMEAAKKAEARAQEAAKKKENDKWGASQHLEESKAAASESDGRSEAETDEGDGIPCDIDDWRLLLRPHTVDHSPSPWITPFGVNGSGAITQDIGEDDEWDPGNDGEDAIGINEPWPPHSPSRNRPIDCSASTASTITLGRNGAHGVDELDISDAK
ncbi:uncharacterized protein F5Z01DRAFT_123085 [Emericellopsis atlantica]|uniref:Uncharacterized protein n=1 Tax=Emericellopsis atlantica TaxID=2614577 RepID=A0A9P8CR05_9HYPO|nr:uncharacterized protein F5Z01DRAFT_123085 [Emericellopsis atlantica]KAG9254251.1 hypothetical protein F5Z01DRAFT_123085 [Emericellopsis atlantica]